MMGRSERLFAKVIGERSLKICILSPLYSMCEQLQVARESRTRVLNKPGRYERVLVTHFFRNTSYTERLIGDRVTTAEEHYIIKPTRDRHTDPQEDREQVSLSETSGLRRGGKCGHVSPIS